MFEDALSEFRVDWRLAGKQESTVDFYIDLLERLATANPDPDLTDVRNWVTCAPTEPMRRKRAQAVRAFGQWSESIGDNDFSWWRHVPVLTEKEKPQPTATVDDFEAGMKSLCTVRDRAVLAILWGCGLRRSEVSRLLITDISISDGALIVRSSKTGKPRVAPMPPITVRWVRRHLRQSSGPSLFDMSPNSIRLMLRRYELLPCHAWRRGWAVHALRNGVSEASVRSAAGWSSGAMVARYTRAKAGELALDEFRRSWST